MKVLIITYYWPPAGGSGVQRWLKFVKYLQHFEIEPVVYTVENPSYAIEDQSLSNEVPNNIEIVRQPIFEPNTFFSKFGSKSKKESAGFLNPNPSFLGKIAQYVRANYFIPDARKFWIKPSVKFLKTYLQENKIDAIITTGPPHSMHMIGLELKKQLQVKWLADFRDPWTEIDYFHQLPLTQKSKRKHSNLENEVLSKADIALVVGESMKKSFAKVAKRVEVIPNGFDTQREEIKSELDTSFSITHVGLMNADRNPKILWEAINELSNEHEDFGKDCTIRLIGKLANEVKNDVQKLDVVVEYIDYVEHHSVRKYQQSTQVLLLSINHVPSARGIITGKIFEYLQAKRPILAIGPEDGDAAEIIKKTASGVIFGFENKEGLKSHLLELYQAYKKGTLEVDSKNIKQYHRKELTGQLADLLRTI